MAPLALILGLALALAPQGDPPPEGSPIALLQKGIFAIQRGDHASARRAFEAVVDLEPRNATAYYYLAVCDARDQDPQGALRRLTQAVESGFETWPALPDDPSFAALREVTSFRQGLEALLERHRQRLRGIVAGLEFEFRVRDCLGLERSSQDLRGKVVVLLFFDPRELSSLEAASLVSGISAGRDDVAVIGLARVSGKGPEERDRVLLEYRSRHDLRFPLAAVDDVFRARLRPFRRHPTVLFLDRNGVPRRIIEGLPGERSAQAFRAALAAAAAFPAEGTGETGKTGSSSSEIQRTKGRS